MSVKWNGWVLHYTVHWLATINRARGTTVGACSQHAYTASIAFMLLKMYNYP